MSCSGWNNKNNEASSGSYKTLDLLPALRANLLRNFTLTALSGRHTCLRDEFFEQKGFCKLRSSTHTHRPLGSGDILKGRPGTRGGHQRFRKNRLLAFQEKAILATLRKQQVQSSKALKWRPRRGSTEAGLLAVPLVE